MNEREGEERGKRGGRREGERKITGSCRNARIRHGKNAKSIKIIKINDSEKWLKFMNDSTLAHWYNIMCNAN